MSQTARTTFFLAILSFVCSTLWTTVSVAQDTVTVTGVGRVDYSRFSADTKKQAITKAQQAALKKYVAKLPTAKKRMLKSLEVEFYNALSDFVIETNVQQEKKDKSTKTFSVAIMATIDTGAIDAFFIDNSAAGNQLVGDASDFGAMFIARVAVSQKAFDAKRTTVRESDSTAVLEEESASDGTRSVDSSRAKSLDIERSGGSTVRKRDETSYEPNIDVGEDIAGAVEEQLVNAGFEPMDISDLEEFGVPFLDEVYDEMRDSGRLPTRMRKQYQQAAIDAGWTFLGMGTIDIGVPEHNAAVGRVRVPATVAFKVWMLTTGRAKTVASVRPQTVYGQGTSAEVAERIAGNDAVKLALDTVVAQLQQKGLR